MPDFDKFIGKPDIETETPFPNMGRVLNTDETQLLYMRDYTNLDIFIDAALYTPPTKVDGSFIDMGSTVVDADLDTQWGAPGFIDSPETKIFGYVDFGDTNPRSIGLKIQSTLATLILTWNLQGSVDAAFTSPVTVVSTTTTNNEIKTIFGSTETFRYYRIECVSPGGGGGATSTPLVFEIFDAGAFGGTVSVSVEVKNSETSEWFEVVSAADVGTSTIDTSVHGYIGRDSLNIGGAIKNYYLPKTTTDLRLRLIVSGDGGNQSSVAIIKSGGL